MTNPDMLNIEYSQSIFLEAVRDELELSADEMRHAQTAPPLLWAAWGLSVLSGDEHIFYPPPYVVGEDAAVQSFFGAPTTLADKPLLDLRHGQLAKRLDALYNNKEPAAQERFIRISELMANWLSFVDMLIGPVEVGDELVTPEPQTYIEPSVDGPPTIRFLDNEEAVFPLDGPLDTVVNLGPGLAGGAYALSLLNCTKHLHMVSGGKSAHFVNAWIDLNVQTWVEQVEHAKHDEEFATSLPDDLDPNNANFPKMHFYTNGIAAGMRALPLRQTVDAMIMSSVHTAGPQECLAGVAAAAERLRPGGVFVVKAPDISLEGEAGMDLLLDPAARLLGPPVLAGECGEVLQLQDSELPQSRPASFAIYQKQ